VIWRVALHSCPPPCGPLLPNTTGAQYTANNTAAKGACNSAAPTEGPQSAVLGPTAPELKRRSYLASYCATQFATATFQIASAVALLPAWVGWIPSWVYSEWPFHVSRRSSQ
jgi:hypothetical protein